MEQVAATLPAHAPAETGRERTPWGWLAALTALAVVLRSIGLNGGLWLDEIFTLHEGVRVPFVQLLTTFPGNRQHTFYSVLAQASVAAFGEQPWSLRLPAMLAGAAAVPALYVFARNVAGRTEALLASFLFAVAYHPVWFAQNARGYTLVALLSILASHLLLRGLATGRTRDFVWYGVVSAFNVYTHLVMVFLVATHALLCLLPPRMSGIADARRSRWQPAIGFLVAGGLTLLMNLPLLAGMAQFFVEHVRPPRVASPAWVVPELLRGLQIGVAGWAAGLVGGALVLAGLWSYLRQSVFVAGMFVLPGVITLAAAAALNQHIFPRYLFFLSGFAILIVVRGAVEIDRLLAPARLASAISLVLIAAMSAASVVALATNYRYPKQDFEGALRFVDAHRGADEPVATVRGTAMAYRMQYGRDFTEVTSLEQWERLRAEGRRVWMLQTLDENTAVEIPDLKRALDADCAIAAVFRGTVAHGDVTVCTAPPIPPM